MDFTNSLDDIENLNYLSSLINDLKKELVKYTLPSSGQVLRFLKGFHFITKSDNILCADAAQHGFLDLMIWGEQHEYPIPAKLQHMAVTYKYLNGQLKMAIL